MKKMWFSKEEVYTACVVLRLALKIAPFKESEQEILVALLRRYEERLS